MESSDVWVWFIAGPNGAGKSTLARKLRRENAAGLYEPDHPIVAPYSDARIVWLDPDRMALERRRAEPSLDIATANALGVLEVEVELDECIRERRPCVVETVLSSEKYKTRVEQARAVGLRVGLVYIMLASPDLAILRVRDRVAAGGHDVDEEKIRSRWSRTYDNLRWFARHVDRILVYSNDLVGGEPKLIVAKDSPIDEAALHVLDLHAVIASAAG